MHNNIRSLKVGVACLGALILLVIISARFYNFNLKSQMPPKEIVELKEAALRGDYEVAGKLAWMYEDGTRGISQDYKESYFFFSITYVQVQRSDAPLLQDRIANVKKRLSVMEISEVDQRILIWMSKHPNLIARQPAR